MRALSRWLVVGVAVASAACKDPAEAVEGERVPPRAAKASGQATGASGHAQANGQANAQAARRAAPDTAPEGAARKAAKPNAITFDGPIAWKTWEEGQKLARAQNRSMMLLVYADWCPHCRELKPVFADAEVAKLAEGLVMIKQDADDDAAWLGPKVGHLGSYVPRLFFLKPDGTVMTDVTSGNPKFPYFYTPEGIAALKSSMKRAAGG